MALDFTVPNQRPNPHSSMRAEHSSGVTRVAETTTTTPSQSPCAGITANKAGQNACVDIHAGVPFDVALKKWGAKYNP